MSQGDRRELLTLERTGNGLRRDLRPERLRRPVVEQQVAAVEQPRDTKCRRLAPGSCHVRNAGAAQRAIGDGDRIVAEVVVDDFVPVQDPDRVRLHHAISSQAEYPVGGGKTCGTGGRELRRVDRRNAVPPGPPCRIWSGGASESLRSKPLCVCAAITEANMASAANATSELIKLRLMFLIRCA